MLEPMLTLRIKCPTCGNQRLEQFAKRLTNLEGERGRQLWLHSTCHHQQWQASPDEVMEIREFVRNLPAD